MIGEIKHTDGPRLGGAAVFWWCAYLLLFFFNVPAHAASYEPITLQVGPERALKNPSAAAKLAGAGDIIEIDAGLYFNDYASWNQSNLTIRGVAIANIGSC